MVGPACVLTHAHRRALVLLALLFSNSDLIRTFGEAGFIATVIALITVLTLVPLLGVLLVRNEKAFAAKVRQRRCRRPGAAPLLRLDRRARWSAAPASTA